jgi:hypothetical protein
MMDPLIITWTQKSQSIKQPMSHPTQPAMLVGGSFFLFSLCACRTYTHTDLRIHAGHLFFRFYHVIQWLKSFLLQWVSHFWDFIARCSDSVIFAIASQSFLDLVRQFSYFIARYSDSSILLQWLSHSWDLARSFIRFTQSFILSSTCTRILVKEIAHMINLKK